jgi:hypothetical protein
MGKQTAARPTGLKTRKPRARKSASREAISPDFIMRALAVFDGQRCLGHLLPRGRMGVEAFDADDRSLGIFPDQKSAADAVSEAAI